MTTIGKSLGYAYIATRTCGRVSGLAWDDVDDVDDGYRMTSRAVTHWAEMPKGPTT